MSDEQSSRYRPLSYEQRYIPRVFLPDQDGIVNGPTRLAFLQGLLLGQNPYFIMELAQQATIPLENPYEGSVTAFEQRLKDALPETNGTTHEERTNPRRFASFSHTTYEFPATTSPYSLHVLRERQIGPKDSATQFVRIFITKMRPDGTEIVENSCMLEKHPNSNKHFVLYSLATIDQRMKSTTPAQQWQELLDSKVTANATYTEYRNIPIFSPTGR